MVNPVAAASVPTLVLGAADTGKTSLLADAVAGRIRDGEPAALVLVATRQLASELRDRIVRAAGRTTVAPQVMTVHALCRTIVARFADPEDATPGLLTAPEQEFRIRELLAGSTVVWPDDIVQALGTRTFAQQVRAVLARARHLGLDPADVAEAGVRAGEPGWRALGAFMAEYLDVLDAEQTLDYAELVHRARLLLEDAGVLDALRREYAAVYVDDWCELDPSQMGLIRSLAGDAMPVVALADPDTAIFRFRGAHPRAAAEFLRLFASPTRTPEVVTLRVAAHRPALHLAACTGVARRLGAPALGAAEVDAYRNVASEAAGRIDALTFPDAATQGRFVAAELRTAHLEDGLAWGDMAVLVRAGRTQLPALARVLTDAGIPVEVAGDEIGLASELAVRPLLLGLEVAAAGGRPDADQANRLLMSGWGGFDAVTLRAVGRRLRAADPATGGVPTDELVAQALAGLREIGEEDADLALRRDALARATTLMAADARPDAVLWELWSAVPWADRLRAEAMRGGESSPRADHDLDVVCALFGLAGESLAPGGPAGAAWFAAEVAQQQIPADSERTSAVAGRGVRLLTAHRAKGRRWPLVVVTGAQEGVWPDVRRRGSVFDPQRLGTAGLGEGTTTRDLVATERRLFLLACSRATSRLIVTALEGTEGEEDRPSRFLGELGVPVRHVIDVPDRLHTLRELVTDLRRVAQDAAASPGLRDAAARRLAALADAVDDDGRPLVPDADPARWWGLGEATSLVAPASGPAMRLTPSQVESLITCPRQYFLRREARAEPPRESRTILGSVIHAVAERAATGDLGPESASEALDAIWDDIPFAAAWLSSSERAEADAAVARFLAWQAGHEHADLLGVEVPVRARLDVDGRPVELVGTVDRLERLADGRLRVVDFKTGRTKPTVAEAAATPQIGVYQLAIESGGFDEIAPDAGGSGGASLVYLRHDDAPGWPKEFRQPSLTEKPHLSDDAEERAHPTWVHHRIAQACGVLESGRFDARPGDHCQWCPVRSSCPARSSQVVS